MEWSYGFTEGGDEDASGVTPCLPGLSSWHKYYKGKELGPTPLSEEEVGRLLDEMAGSWKVSLCLSVTLSLTL